MFLPFCHCVPVNEENDFDEIRESFILEVIILVGYYQVFIRQTHLRNQLGTKSNLELKGIIFDISPVELFQSEIHTFKRFRTHAMNIYIATLTQIGRIGRKVSQGLSP